MKDEHFLRQLWVETNVVLFIFSCVCVFGCVSVNCISLSHASSCMVGTFAIRWLWYVSSLEKLVWRRFWDAQLMVSRLLKLFSLSNLERSGAREKWQQQRNRSEGQKLSVISVPFEVTDIFIFYYFFVSSGFRWYSIYSTVTRLLWNLIFIYSHK